MTETDIPDLCAHHWSKQVDDDGLVTGEVVCTDCGAVLADLLSERLRGQDLNLRPSGYEPDELPDCSTGAPERAV